MSVKSVSSPVDIAISGLRAQALRMNVISSNIANANVAQTPLGEPYQRQELVLSTAGQMSGVTIGETVADTESGFKREYEPGNPLADAEGYVQMSNVNLPMEMINMLAASRAYQANAAVLKRYQEMIDLTVELLK